MASVENTVVHCRRNLAGSSLFMYLFMCGARDGRPVFPRPASPSTVSFVHGGDS
jgi:hypothetical protein